VRPFKGERTNEIAALDHSCAATMINREDISPR